MHVDIVHMLPAYSKLCDIIFYKLGSNLWEKKSLGINGSLLTVISGTWQIYCILVVNCHRIINKSNLIGEEKYSLSYQNNMVKMHV